MSKRMVVCVIGAAVLCVALAAAVVLTDGGSLENLPNTQPGTIWATAEGDLYLIKEPGTEGGSVAKGYSQWIYWGGIWRPVALTLNDDGSARINTIQDGNVCALSLGELFRGTYQMKKNGSVLELKPSDWAQNVNFMGTRKTLTLTRYDYEDLAQRLPFNP
ncbi:MAG: hypothetical protein IKY86_00170 [Clostridia bacterium]|nr:hypothetical protein [Clostridia bacterium]